MNDRPTPPPACPFRCIVLQSRQSRHEQQARAEEGFDSCEITEMWYNKDVLPRHHKRNGFFVAYISARPIVHTGRPISVNRTMARAVAGGSWQNAGVGRLVCVLGAVCCV